MPHLRKITRDQAIAIQDAQSAEQHNAELSAYAAAALFSAVQVGESPTYLYFHVNLGDSNRLPGTSLGQYSDLGGYDRKAVLECTYEGVEDMDGEEVPVTRRVKIKDLPQDTQSLETDLIPHRFA